MAKRPVKSRPINVHAEEWLPASLKSIENSQAAIPNISKNHKLIQEIEEKLPYIPTQHNLYQNDARNLSFLAANSVQLVLTSPPYWTLKEYREHPCQLGYIANYEDFLEELDRVWKECFRVLVPGGRLICVVGDVCLSRRKNKGEHTVVPLHASIQESCRKIGYSNLNPIIWHKISNAKYEASNSNGGFLGKPYEPNAVIKNDIEFILMERKSGGYRSPSLATRILSVIPSDRHKMWFQQIWHGITGASTKHHPAPYPLELAERLIRMFSFVGDTVLDPFMGTGTTNAAAGLWGRNSIGVEIDGHYFNSGAERIENALKKYKAGCIIRYSLEDTACSPWTRSSAKLSGISGPYGEISKNAKGAKPEKDAGSRAAVTGGKHGDGFIALLASIIRSAGLTDAEIFINKKTLPGYFRPSKDWDLIVRAGDNLVAVIEVKSHIGSFGNNFNNRVEEALGNAADFWAAYSKATFKPSARPWLGYLMLLEDAPKSKSPCRKKVLPHYQLREEFQCISYAQRYEIFCERLVRERLYDATCFLVSDAKDGAEGKYSEPNKELCFQNFAASLSARAGAFANIK